MSGICEAVENSVLVASTQDGGITVNFFPGEQLNFCQDKEHKDRLMVQKGFDVTVSVTAPKFYELFKVVWKGE